ncbi:MAG: DUF481 domain-containing protein [Candidatus Bipolaricaulota bacterium]|nr:DUF481 domain-containing protein [Candidatus Bipolaricaulota bacterium]MDW8140963.1 hypothetical protein [Candidatus Bipolaricaulota bacterium]
MQKIMRTTVIIVLALAFWTAPPIWAQRGIGPLCGYTPPISEFQDLKLSGNYRYYNDPFTDNRSNDSSGSLRASFSRFFDAPTYGISQQAMARVDLDRGSVVYQADAALNLRGYLPETNFFGFTGIEGQGTSALPMPGLKISAGGGYGRFKDVTPLAKALKIQERLLELKAIRSPLPPTAIFEIADTIGRRREFPDLAALVQNLEEIIERSGLVPQGQQLGAVALLRIEEILNETADEKLCGWEVRLGVGYELLDPTDERRELLVLASFDYSLAPAPRSQFSSKLQLSSAFPLFDDYVLLAKINYLFRLTESIDTQITYSFIRTKPRALEALDLQGLDLRLVFQTQANLNLALQLETSWANDFEEWSQRLILTLNYDLF